MADCTVSNQRFGSVVAWIDGGSGKNSPDLLQPVLHLYAVV